MIETNSFRAFDSSITAQAAAQIDVALNSVDTKVHLRNVRLRFLFFETYKFPTAAIKEHLTFPMRLSFTLHRVTKRRLWDVIVTLVNEDTFSVATVSPIVITASDFALDAGIVAPKLADNMSKYRRNAWNSVAISVQKRNLGPTVRTFEFGRWMIDIYEGLKAALWLVVSLDPELWDISLRSLRVTLTALVVASVIAIPLGTYLAVQRFRYRRFLISLINALMGLPPVVIGLLVYILLSRSGPFGVLNLLFTPTAMIIAQVIIITPVIASIAHQAMRELWAEYHDLLISLNTTKWQRIVTLIRDGRRNLLTAALAGFGRAIGEVGAIMIVGGNIDHVTRVLTTAIALETGKGDFALALGLGFVLIGIAIVVNLTIHTLSRTEREGRW